MSANLHEVAPGGASQVVELPTAPKLHDPITLKLTPPDKVGMVSVRNVLIVLAYLQKKMGFSQEEAHRIMFPERYENEEGREEVLRHERLSRPLDTYLQEDELFPLSDWLILIQRFLKIAGTRRILQEAGANSTRLRHSEFIRSAIMTFRRLGNGPIAAYRLTQVLNTRFNQTKVFNIMSETVDPDSEQVVGCTFMVTFYPGIDPVTDWCSDPWIRGILADVPSAWNADQAEVKVPVLPYSLADLLQREYGLDAHEDDQGNVWLDGQKIGRRVYLLPERSSQAGLDYYPGRYVEEYQRGAHQATLVLRDLFIPEDGQDEDWPVVQRGEIYEAPSFIINVSWKVQGLFRLLTMARNSRKRLLALLAWPLSFLQKRLKIQIRQKTRELSLLELRLEQATGQLEANNAALLAAKEAAEEERAEAQRAREEAEAAYADAARYRSLAEAYLARIHPTKDFTTHLLEGTMEAREQDLAVMFTDLKGSTTFARTHTPAEVFAATNEHLVKMSAIVTKHHGHVVKNTGDGLLAVFGLKPSPNHPCLDALKASLEMQIVMQEDPVFRMRIGMDYGPVMVGALLGQVDTLSKVVSAASRVCDYVAGPDEICVMHYFQRKLPSALPGTHWVENDEVELKNLGTRRTYRLGVLGED